MFDAVYALGEVDENDDRATTETNWRKETRKEEREEWVNFPLPRRFDLVVDNLNMQ